MSKASPGCVLILISWAISIACLWCLHPSFPALFSKLSWFEVAVLVVGPSVSGALFLAGVIAWALAGALSSDLENIQKQNREMIDLLKRIADGVGGPTRPPPPPVELTIPADPRFPPEGITGPEALEK